MNANTELETLVSITAVAARFLRAGEIIERGGHLVEVMGRAIGQSYAPGRVQIVVRDLETDDDTLIPVSLNAELMVPTYDRV